MFDVLNETDKETMYARLSNALITDEWKDIFFVKEYLPFDSIYEDEEFVRSVPMFPYGGFNDPNTIEETVKTCLIAALDKIVDWIPNNKITMRLELDVGYNIGYTVDSPTAEKTPSQKIVLTLKKDSEELSQLGFFVVAFNVI